MNSQSLHSIYKTLFYFSHWLQTKSISIICSLFCIFHCVQSPSPVWLLVTSWTAARQASLFLTISQSLPKFMSIASEMPSSHLILWHPLLLPSIFPGIRDFSNESAIGIRWPKYWSFSFSISPMSWLLVSDGQNTGASVLPTSIQGWFPLRLSGLVSLLSKGLSWVFSNTTVQRHQFFGLLPSLRSSSHNSMWPQGLRPSPWL